jgi:hypothetical protein
MSVKLTAIAAVLAVVAVPIAVQGEPAPASAPAKAPSARRVCTVTPTLGSRVNNVRRCRSQEEYEAEKQEARQIVDRVQAFKPTMCAPPRPAC